MSTLTDISSNALRGAISLRGHHRGTVNTQPPRLHTNERAAWEAICSIFHPERMTIKHMLGMCQEERLVYCEIKNFFYDKKAVDIISYVA